MTLATRLGAPALPSMRSSVLPAVAIMLLLGLVFLLPKRGQGELADGTFLLPGSAAAGRDVAEVLLSLPALELVEPPAWAAQPDKDAQTRNLDRLAWASNHGIERARVALAEDPQGLGVQALERLQTLRENDLLQAAKLISALADADPDTPGLVAELSRSSLSTSGLVAMSALRVLADHPSPDALGGILLRRHDPDLDVRATARGALSRRLQNGDVEALTYVLEDVESNLRTPDLAYVTVLAEAPTEERVLSVLRTIAREGAHEASLIALGALLVHGDEEAEARLDEMIMSRDLATRLNALRTAALNGRIIARGQWETIVRQSSRPEVLTLMSMLAQAVDTGDPEAPQAAQLLEEIATSPEHSCQAEALDVLLRQGHPWAVERTRAELQQSVGAYLGLTVDRVVLKAGRLGPQFADVALARLASPGIEDGDRVMLCRLIVGVDPPRAADLIVGFALEEPSVLSRGVLPLVSALGEAGLQRLEREVGSDRGAGLYVYAAAHAGSPGSVDVLASIVLDEARDPFIRQQAFDCIARLTVGPREDTLRRVALELRNQEWSHRARLLYWNYL